MGLRTLQARSQYLLATALRLAGNQTESTLHYQEALRILDEIRKEPGAEKLFDRADLKSLFDEASRFSAKT